MNKEALIDEIAFIVEGVDVIGPTKTAEEIIKHLKNNGILNKESKADKIEIKDDTLKELVEEMKNNQLYDILGIHNIEFVGVKVLFVLKDDDGNSMLAENKITFSSFNEEDFENSL